MPAGREGRKMADILIAGAGLGGLTAALTLIQRGHAVRVFEQAPELREIVCGVQLGAKRHAHPHSARPGTGDATSGLCRHQQGGPAG